jgi:hypothetical protein
MTEENQNPSLVDKAKNLANFSWELLQYLGTNREKALFVSDEIYAERVSICRSCEKINELENSCRECGCYIPAKAKIILDSCPLKKWDMDKEGWDERFTEIQRDIDKTL